MKRRTKPKSKGRVKDADRAQHIRGMTKFTLRVARHIRDYKQQDFLHLGIPQSYFSDFETGKKDRFSDKMKKDIELELRMIGRIDWNK